MDSYKEARDARVKREFAQGLAAIDEQGAGPKQFTPDMMPEAAPDPNAPTNMAGLANTPQMTAPTMPLSPQQRLQQQIALANRLGLGQEAANFTNQLTSLNQREEDMRYRAQRDTMSDIYRDEELEARKAEAASQASLRAAQAAGLTQTQQQQAADRVASEAALAGANDVSTALLSGNSIFAGFEDAKKRYADNPAALNAYSRAVYDKFRESTGLSEGDIYKSVASVTAPLSQFINTPYDDPTKMLAGFQKVLDSIDPDLTDNIRPEPVPRPDGTWAIKYGDAEIPGLEGKDLQDVAAKYMTIVQKDPMEAVSIYDRNKNLQISKLAAAKDASEQRKLLADILKSNSALLRDEDASGRILDALNAKQGGYEVGEGGWGTGVDMSQSNRAILSQIATQMGAPVEKTSGGLSTLDSLVKKEAETASSQKRAQAEFDAKEEATLLQLDDLYGGDDSAKLRALDAVVSSPDTPPLEKQVAETVRRRLSAKSLTESSSRGLTQTRSNF
jgi:hypothetical protein